MRQHRINSVSQSRARIRSSRLNVCQKLADVVVPLAGFSRWYLKMLFGQFPTRVLQLNQVIPTSGFGQHQFYGSAGIEQTASDQEATTLFLRYVGSLQHCSEATDFFLNWC